VRLREIQRLSVQSSYAVCWRSSSPFLSAGPEAVQGNVGAPLAWTPLQVGQVSDLWPSVSSAWVRLSVGAEPWA
jgi:hypothetical protein